MSCLYILEIEPLSVASFANIFSHSESCLFILFMAFFTTKAFKFNYIPFVYFCFYFHYSSRWVKKDLAAWYSVLTYMSGMEEGRGGVQEGGDICIIQIADSLCCTAETGTTLQSNSTPIKKKKK